MPETDPSFSSDVDLLHTVALEAGDLALSYFEKGTVPTWEKYPGHPVTEADLEVNRLVRDRLMEAQPGYGWLSEESGIHLVSLVRYLIHGRCHGR